MVKLYGAFHGMQVQDILGISRKVVNIWPSKEIIQDISTLPKGAKIGIEGLRPGEMDIVSDEIFSASDEISNGKWHIKFHRDVYWPDIAKRCAEAGYEIVYLEDMDIWRRYNQATLHNELVNLSMRNLFLEGDNQTKYNLRHFRRREGAFISETATRRIHEIERDELLLEAVRTMGVDAAIVGIAHSDSWMLDHERIYYRYGIMFDSYCTDIVEEHRTRFASLDCVDGDIDCSFHRNPLPDEVHKANRRNLERRVSLVESGRIMPDKTPDYIGTWDLITPSEGYFELFIDSRQPSPVCSGAELIEGTIEDLLGHAEFQAKDGETSLEFGKGYCGSAPGSMSGPIFYYGLKEGEYIIGTFGAKQSKRGRPFIMKKAAQAKPIELAIMWNKLAMEEKARKKQSEESMNDFLMSSKSGETKEGDIPF